MSNRNQEQLAPPQWPLRLLRFFIRKSYLEEIEGDMEEEFSINLERMPLSKARRLYTWEMFKLIRPVLIRNLFSLRLQSQHAMFANYFKVSFRGLMKSPLNSFINVFGLAAALGICVFAYAFWQWTVHTDQFHKLKDEVYLVTFFADRDGTSQQYGTTPRPLGEMLRHDVPAIKKVCRVDDRPVVVKHADNVYHETIRFTDKEFLDLFTFPLKWGSASALADVNSIILNESMSEKYFGDANPVGSSILVYFGKANSKEFKVGGVAEKFPEGKTISFDFLASFENLRTADSTFDAYDWSSFLRATLIQVPNPQDLAGVTAAMQQYKDQQNAAVKPEWAIKSFAFEPIATLHKKSSAIRDDISRSSDGNYATIYYLLFLSLLLLVLACTNYINIAIVTAARRLKEIGVRKSIGANRTVVVLQFLTENLLVTFFALTVGVILAISIFIPGFERMWDFSMGLRASDPYLWFYLIAVMVLTSLASGFYPALYISKFQVVGIMKGSVRFGRKSPLTKVFLCIQLVVGCMFITSAIMFTQNSTYLSHRPWGYDQASSMYARLPDARSQEQLSAAMSQVPTVESMSGSLHHVGRSHQTVVLNFPDREYEVDQLAVDAHYLETMGLHLKDGRFFHDNAGSDKNAVVVNELMVKNLGWEKPIGQTFRMDDREFEVVGIVQEFHSYSFSKTVRPIVFRKAASEEYRYLSLQVTPGTQIETYKALQDNWIKLFPEVPFDGGLQEDVWGFYFEEIKIQSLVWRVFATIALTLALLGLYGLISLNVEGRVRELSIRKVLGAGISHIAASVSQQYVVLFLLAIVIGGPLGYYASTRILDSAYTYHMPFTYSGVIMALTLMTIIILTTVAMQVVKVQKANPVDGLKVE